MNTFYYYNYFYISIIRLGILIGIRQMYYIITFYGTTIYQLFYCIIFSESIR